MIPKYEVKCVGVDQVIANLTALQKEELPFATSLSLNKTAQLIREEEYKEMKRVFKDPTPYTLRSLMIRVSTKKKLIASVDMKDDAVRYIYPEVHGGGREHKRMEYYLRSSGYMGPGQFAVPGSGAKFDRYGNMSKSQIIQVLSVLGTFREVGYLMNRSKRSSKKNKKPRAYFALRWRWGSLVPGVYERLRGTVRPILIFVDRISYRPVLKFYKIASDTFQKEYATMFKQCLDEVLHGQYKKR